MFNRYTLIALLCLVVLAGLLLLRSGMRTRYWRNCNCCASRPA